MSGHSKWSQIKHKKALSDQAKGALFSKLARAISLATRENPDPKTNLNLVRALERARELNMPNESIERALKRIHDRSQAQLQELRLEALGPGGVALIISVITDNKNRSLAEIKTILGKHGAHVVREGSLLWMFKKDNPVRVPVSAEVAQELDRLQEVLDEHPDVQQVFLNEVRT